MTPPLDTSRAAASASTAKASSTSSLSQALGSTPSGADGEQRFLKLLVTQLNNQDPLNPLDNAQLTSQLAQMSTVSGIEKLNGALESLLAQSSASQVLQSAALIGRDVQVAGSGDTPAAPARVVSVGQEAGAVTLELATGARVRLADVRQVN